MKHRPVRHRLEYAVYRAATALLGRSSPAGARRCGRGLGRLAHRLDRSRRRVALANLSAALPERGTAEAEAIARGCFERLGAGLLEIPAVQRVGPEAFAALFRVEGEEHLEAALAARRGFLLLAAHFGTWEPGAAWLARRLGDFHVVARPPDNPFVARHLARVRERFGMEVIPPRGAGRRAFKILKRGGGIGMLADQRVQAWSGILVPFLGRPAWTSHLPARLSLFTGAPALVATCLPGEEGGYHLRFDPPVEPAAESVSRAEAEEALTRRYLERVEAQIRSRPELWLWMHRRWRLVDRHREEWALERCRRASRLPAGGDLEELLPALPEEAARVLRQVPTGGFLEGTANLLLEGPGAARLAVALGRAALRDGRAVHYCPAPRLARRWREAEADGSLAVLLRELDRFALLILPEVQELADDSRSLESMRSLLARRLGRGSVLLTRSGPALSWSDLLGSRERAGRDRRIRLPSTLLGAEGFDGVE